MIGLAALLLLAPAAGAASPAVCRDGATPDQAITAVYDLVSVPPGQGWDWDRLGDLFLGQGRFVTMMSRPSGATATIATVQDLRTQTEATFADSGFIEAEYRRQTHVFGDIASIYSSFYVALPAADAPLMRGLHHFQLVRTDGCWRIVSNMSRMEGPDWQLPDQWEPASADANRPVSEPR